MELVIKLDIHCPVCNEKKKDRNSKVHYDGVLSDRKLNKNVYFCTNHGDNYIHFVIQVFEVEDVIVSVRQYIFSGRLPK